MAAALHMEAVVQPDGKIEITVPELSPGLRVTITIEIPDMPDTNDRPNPAPRHYTAIELMHLPREERDRILEAAAEAAAEEYVTNPDLTGFEAFGEDDLYDDHSDGHSK